MRRPEEAIEYARGDIELTCCQSCGFIQNDAFDPGLQDYSSEYEETQGFSGTFSGFQRGLAEELVERFDLRARRILEIGCGKGAFLTLLCQIGDNEGIGFDPAYVENRVEVPPDPRVRFVKDLYSAEYGDGADFVCCQMTLEHVDRPLDLLRTVREAEGVGPDTRLFVQVPDFERIMTERAFWDVYYEHCSYFTSASLKALFRRAGFTVTDVWRAFQDQYLMVCGVPSSDEEVGGDGEEARRITGAARDFGSDVERICDRARRWLSSLAGAGRRAVLWGAGSKAVALLSSLGPDSGIEYAVDINPYRQGTFLAGGGQAIIAPERLPALDPAVVIVMNPVYVGEIRENLARLGLAPELMSVDEVGALEP